MPNIEPAWSASGSLRGSPTQRLIGNESFCLPHSLGRLPHASGSRLPADDRARMEAEAEWSALRVSFKVSSAPKAADVYDFADLRIDDARRAGLPPKGNRVETFLEFAKRTIFAEEVSDAASYWAEHAALESKVAQELAELRLAREQRSRETTVELLRMVQKLRDSPPAEEADIFAEDPEGR